MPTNREMKLLLQPLLKRRPDLAFARQLLFFAPFSHYFRGVYFEQSRWGGSFNVQPIVATLCDGFEVHSHWPISRQPKSFIGPWDDKDRLSQEVCDLVENNTLPMVEPIDNPREHKALLKRSAGPFSSNILCDTVIVCLLEDYDQAFRMTAKFAKAAKRPPFEMGEVTEESKYDDRYWYRMMYLHRLLETNRSKIPQLLVDWERHAVTQSKLTKYWKPTPLDFEA